MGESPESAARLKCREVFAVIEAALTEETPELTLHISSGALGISDATCAYILPKVDHAVLYTRFC
jgi:hypothetical protein